MMPAMASPLPRPMRQRLRSLRHDAGLSQAELGGRVGCTQQAIHGIEAGRHGLTVDLAMRLARELGVPLGNILDSTDEVSA